MKVLLYLEGKSILEKSGIGRALHHQMRALDLAGIPYTTDILGDYDVVHINTYGPRSLMLFHFLIFCHNFNCDSILKMRKFKLLLSKIGRLYECIVEKNCHPLKNDSSF